MKSILLSGASGFLGSHLAKDLSASGYQIIALIRSSSNLSRFDKEQKKKVIFVNADDSNFKTIIAGHKPQWLIHSAWGGVSASGRSDWQRQAENITHTVEVLELMLELGINNLISFGSQAEYGEFNGRISENAQCKPVTAYGAAKLATLELVRAYCESKKIHWLWLRLFSTYGTHEGKEWLIPSVISNILNSKPMDLTPCEQVYDYLFTKDLGRAIAKVIETQGESGVYNLSSNTSIRLRSLIEKVRDFTDEKAVLNFGALAYRPNQVMHMEGDSGKFNAHFDFKVESSLDENIKEIVRHYSMK